VVIELLVLGDVEAAHREETGHGVDDPTALGAGNGEDERRRLLPGSRQLLPDGGRGTGPFLQLVAQL